MNLEKLLHLKGLRWKLAWFLVNRVFKGTNAKYFDIKRRLLIWAGNSVGEGTKIVGPIECYCPLEIGKDCWIGKDLKVNGNGKVVIGDRCDIAPEVTFQTGGHEIGDKDRRAGAGKRFTQIVKNGVWIGGRVTVLNDTVIGEGSVVASCACVTHDVEPNTLVGGIPAKVLRRLTDEAFKE